MTPAAQVQLAQAIAASAWIVDAIYFAWIARKLLVRGSPLSAFAAVLSLIGWTQAGFTARWYIWAGAVADMGGLETAAWTKLYVLSAIEAAALLVAGETYRRLSQ